jgi:hypothetical protein
MRCPHCGENTFTIAGWSDLDRCSNCDRPLQSRIDVDAALAAKRRAAKHRGSRRRAPGTSAL